LKTLVCLWETPEIKQCDKNIINQMHNFSSSKGKINAPHIKTENTLFGTLGSCFFCGFLI
jgi:hypothetical protein